MGDAGTDALQNEHPQHEQSQHARKLPARSMDSFSSQKEATLSKRYIYAELLLNIRQVTVSVSLAPPSNSSTTLRLSSNRQSIELSHDGQQCSIQLPAEVIHPQQPTLSQCPPDQGQVLAIPSPPSQELSVRLPLADYTSRGASVGHRAGNEIPWSAARLPASAQFQCCNCANIFVSHGCIKAWKDLPSDNWAEMMDFWHCHKPTGHQHAGNRDAPGMDKGYAASNKLIATPGVGFVDLCYFQFHPSDVAGANIQPGHEGRAGAENESLLCKQCKATIGVVDNRAEGYRLYKWSLSLQQPHTLKPISYPLQHFVSAQLLSLIDNQAVRRFVLTSSKPGEISGLELWVFNPDLYYTSTSTPHPQRAMKVFSKPIPKAQEYLEMKGSSHEEVNLPHEIYERMKKILTTSCLAVFKSSKGFEGWDAGLLERFDGEGV
ncbi:MAG: hypothetical protein M1836_001433 [Candelina mexicana]|nr:MAG: hypothetical protein M1836_001433 [Candelina mexicana]